MGIKAIGSGLRRLSSANLKLYVSGEHHSAEGQVAAPLQNHDEIPRLIFVKMVQPKKRKEGHEDGTDHRSMKRSKGGSGGKWQTPHQQAKAASRRHGKIEPGDCGIWATCARRQEARATEELKIMFEECAERFYGLISSSDEIEEEDSSCVDDIESSIQKEVASMGNTQRQTRLFSPVYLDLECVLFFKTRAPIDPVEFVHRICEEVTLKPGIRRMRYVNRLTPMVLIGRATEKGLDDVGKTVLGQHFNLSGVERKEGDGDELRRIAPYSYAIRPSIRNNTTLKRDAVIQQVASMVGDGHKVDLTRPDKVIIVEIYQTVCGMSVVGSDWDSLKRFNLAELYQPTKPPPVNKAESSPQSVTTNEA